MITAEEYPLACTREQFLAATPEKRRKFILTQIDLTPWDWNQGWWKTTYGPIATQRLQLKGHNTCGSAYCYAGWATALAGIEINDVQTGKFLDHGKRLLDLTELQALVLFDGTNTRDNLDEIITHIEGGTFDTWFRDACIYHYTKLVAQCTDRYRHNDLIRRLEEIS